MARVLFQVPSAVTDDAWSGFGWAMVLIVGHLSVPAFRVNLRVKPLFCLGPRHPIQDG